MRCVWSLATRRQMDVPRLREKAKLLRTHIKSLVLTLNRKQHKLIQTPIKCRKLLILFFMFLYPPDFGKELFFQLIAVPLETCLTV